MTEKTLPQEVLAFAKQLAALSEDEFFQLEQQADIQLVQGPISYEGAMAFMRLLMWDPLAKAHEIKPATHHETWIRAIVENNRVLLLAAPESAKTTVTILMTAYMIGKNPASQSIVVSVSDDQAEKIVGLISAYIEHHPAWKLCFPDIVPDKKRGWGYDKGFFVKRDAVPYGDWLVERGKRKDPTLLGVGYSNRAIIGKRVDGIFVVDDMIDENNSASEAELEKAKAIFRKTIASRVTEEGKMVVIGTPWREDDVYAYALATGLYKSYVIPAWKEMDVKDDDGNPIKQLVSYWPEHWPVDRLKSKQIELGERDFQLMYLMDLEAQKGTILKEEWLHPFVRNFEIDPMWPLFYGIDFAVTSADLGVGRGRGKRFKRSNFALAKVRAAPFGLIVTDGWVGQISLYEAIDKIKSWVQAELPKRVQVETWGTGDLFLQMLVREGLTVFGYKDTKDKTTRFQRMAVHFEVGRIRLSDAETRFLQHFKNEWVGFPNFHTDDTLDAVACAIDAAGINVYAGQRVIAELDRAPKVEAMPWGGSWGMPKSRFQGNR